MLRRSEQVRAHSVGPARSGRRALVGKKGGGDVSRAARCVGFRLRLRALWRAARQGRNQLNVDWIFDETFARGEMVEVRKCETRVFHRFGIIFVFMIGMRMLMLLVHQHLSR